MKKNFFIITAVVCGMSCTTTAYAQFKIGGKKINVKSEFHMLLKSKPPSNVRLEFASISSQSIPPNSHFSVIFQADSLNAALVSLH